MKKAITLSIIAHLLLLALLLFASKQNQQRQHQQQKQLQNQKQALVIEAHLLFPTETTQPVTITPEPLSPKNQAQEPTEALQSKLEKPKLEKPRLNLTQPDQVTAQSVAEEPSSPQVQQPSNEQRVTEQQINHSFDPYQSVQSIINNENEKFFEQLNVQQQAKLTAKPQAKSINSQSSPEAQPQIKALYETAQQVSPDTRVINYHGKCVQIQRTTDFNGFSQFKWSSTTLDCGADKDMKKQLKLSLDKFLKPKSIKPRELQ